jgi:hypothetical protein
VDGENRLKMRLEQRLPQRGGGDSAADYVRLT